MQNSKGGVSSQFGGSGASQMIGAKKTTDLLEKITWGLAVAICVLTLSSNFFINKQSSEGKKNNNIEEASKKQGAAPSIPSPVTEDKKDEKK